jgi:hypothetical protein
MQDLAGGLIIGLVVGGLFASVVLIYRLIKWLQSRQ